MAEQVEMILAGRALTLVYKIPVGKFSHNAFGYIFDVGRAGCAGCHYTADLIVNNNPEYPEIPPSVWTVTLTIMALSGDIRVDLASKERVDGVKYPGFVTVDWRVCGERETMVDDRRMNPSHGNGYTGPEGFKRGHCGSLESLAGVGVRDVQGIICHGLTTETSVKVWVSLTFTVSKPSTFGVLETLYDSNLLADCTLVCDEREFPAHRAILAAQSPVFAAMFESKSIPLSDNPGKTVSTHFNCCFPLQTFDIKDENSSEIHVSDKTLL